MTYGILAQLFIGSHKSSVFSPADEHLGVRYNDADEMRLGTQKYTRKI